MKRHWLAALALAALLMGGQVVVGNEKKVVNFGALEALSPETAQAQAEAWLKATGKMDPTLQEKFQTIWSRKERTVLERVTDTIVMADDGAARLLAEARDPLTPAPTQVPDVLKNDKAPSFYRANLALAYARSLASRRVFEESLDALKLFQPEQVVDPSAYLFHRAISEHALLQKADATKTINRLLDDLATSPERYKTVSALMLLDMQTWKDKDLSSIARKMDNIERRLELARGGPQTQKMQKEVIARLDEMIKELENQAKKKQQPGEGQCPNDGGCPDGAARLAASRARVPVLPKATILPAPRLIVASRVAAAPARSIPPRSSVWPSSGATCRPASATVPSRN